MTSRERVLAAVNHEPADRLTVGVPPIFHRYHYLRGFEQRLLVQAPGDNPSRSGQEINSIV